MGNAGDNGVAANVGIGFEDGVVGAVVVLCALHAANTPTAVMTVPSLMHTVSIEGGGCT